MGLLDSLLLWREKRRRRQSLLSPFVGQYDRDSYRYYRNGRSVTIEAELMTGTVDRMLYRQKNLKWDDNAEQLTSAECAEAYDAVCRHFRSRNLRWKEIEL